MNRILIIALILFGATAGIAQDESLPYGHITLDSFTVTAVQQGLKIQDLIDIMQYDSTLYIAFNNLHFTSYDYRYDLEAFDKKGKSAASRSERVRQQWDETCREQIKEILKSEGSFKNRRGKEKYYTANLFDRTFYNPGKVCGEVRKSNYRDVIYGTKTDGHVDAIKRVVFNPGSAVKLPIIGKKFGLFDPEFTEYYNYSINSKSVMGYDCYEFTIETKPQYAGVDKEIVVRKLTTSFNKKDFQVIKRDYLLFYSGALVKLDIKMDIILTQNEGRYYPAYFTYDGFWNVPAKRPEKIHLVTEFVYE